MTVTVLVADHTEIARRAICQLLENQAEVQLVGEASTFGETIQMTRELQPQVLVLDVHMPDNHSVAPEDFKALLTLVKARLVVVSIWGDLKTKELAASFGAETLLDKIDLSETLIPVILRHRINQKFTVLIADDSNLIQLGVRRLLKGQPRIEVVGGAPSFEQALQLAVSLKPRVVLLDLHMPDGTAFEPKVVKATPLNSVERIIAISAENGGDSKARALSYGATTLLQKETLIYMLIPAILGS